MPGIASSAPLVAVVSSRPEGGVRPNQSPRLETSHFLGSVPPMSVVLAILRVPAALGLLVALLLMVGCGPGTARQVAADRTVSAGVK